MDMRTLLLTIPIVSVTGCSSDNVDRLLAPAAIEARVEHKRGTGPDAEFVARAESAVARHPALLRIAAWDKAAAHCGDNGFMPLGVGAAVSDQAETQKTYEQHFTCSNDRLPNDERMSAQRIYDSEWPAPLAGAQVKSGWIGYGYPGSRPYVAFTQMVGVHVAEAYEACGGRAFVVERIESRTDIAPPKPKGQMSQQRVQGARLQYRCLEPEITAAAPIPVSS